MVRVERLIIASLPIILILSTSYFHEVSFAQEHGSRTEDLIIKFYPNIEQAYNALKNGSIDIVNYEIPSDLYEDAINDPNIVLAPVVDRVMYEFDINNNYSTPYNPSIRSPTNYREFRQAIAYLVDKDYIAENLCGGFVERIDQPLSACHSGWINESMWHPNYPYEFDPQASADLLDAAGFIQGSTNNPDYDPTFPGSAHKLRTYPSGHTKAGQILDQLDVVVRTDDFRRLQAGRQLIDNMRKHGIPVNPIEPISIVQIIEWVYDWRDYHIYTGGWSLGRFPSRTAYYLYHSSQYFLGSSNYVTGVDQNGDPNYPELDELLEAAR